MFVSMNILKKLFVMRFSVCFMFLQIFGTTNTECYCSVCCDGTNRFKPDVLFMFLLLIIVQNCSKCMSLTIIFGGGHYGNGDNLGVDIPWGAHACYGLIRRRRLVLDSPTWRKSVEYINMHDGYVHNPLNIPQERMEPVFRVFTWFFFFWWV